MWRTKFLCTSKCIFLCVVLRTTYTFKMLTAGQIRFIWIIDLLFVNTDVICMKYHRSEYLWRWLEMRWTRIQHIYNKYVDFSSFFVCAKRKYLVFVNIGWGCLIKKRRKRVRYERRLYSTHVRWGSKHVEKYAVAACINVWNQFQHSFRIFESLIVFMLWRKWTH